MQLLLATWVGKIIFYLTRITRVGGGSAAPGLYALRLDPKLVEKLSVQIPQNIVITGTNGKTTTARLLSHLVKDQNITVVRNSTGSNLERGVASALISSANWLGKIKGVDLGIWELDEAAFNRIIFQLKPQMIVFLNAFRDQLDRYGEVDSIVSKWYDSLIKVSWDVRLIINLSDTGTSHLLSTINERGGKEANSHLSFAAFKVTNYLVYREKSYSDCLHSAADFQASLTKNLGLKGIEIELKYPQGKLKVKFPVPGPYHIFDLLAALEIYYHLKLSFKDINQKLGSFSPAFGRVEKVMMGKKETFVFLIKNPAGASAVFETLAPEVEKDDRLLIALNDNLADGTDVSWIWDAKFEKLSENKENLTICSGTRAADLAVRLKYAGFDKGLINVEPDLEAALNQAKTNTRGRIFILPTYTALLSLQKLFAKNGVKKHYWKEE